MAGEVHRLETDSTLLVPADAAYTTSRPEGGVTLSIVMDPLAKSRAFAHLDL